MTALARTLSAAAPRAHMRQVRIGACPVCHTSVRADDALALVGFHVAHAECSTVRARRSEADRVRGAPR